MNPSHLEIAFSAIDLLGCYTVTGLFAFRLWLIPEEAKFPAMDSRFIRLYAITLILMVIGGTGHFIVNAVMLGGGSLSQNLALIGQILLNSHFGHSWLIHITAIAVLCSGLFFNRHKMPAKDVAGFMLFISALILLSISATGRADKAGDFTIVEMVDWLHLFTSGLWGGSIIAIAWMLPQGLADVSVSMRKEIQTRINTRLALLTLLAFLLVLTSGIYETWLRLGSLGSFLYSSYGHVLIFKLVFTGFLGIAGLLYYYVVASGLRSEGVSAGAYGQVVSVIGAILVVIILVLSMAMMEIPAPAGLKSFPMVPVNSRIPLPVSGQKTANP